MPTFNRSFGAEIALSQLDGLTTSERSGSLAVDYAMVPARRHKIPAGFRHWTWNFMADPALPVGPNTRPAARSTRPSSPSSPFKPATRQRRLGGGDGFGAVAAA